MLVHLSRYVQHLPECSSHSSVYWSARSVEAMDEVSLSRRRRLPHRPSGKIPPAMKTICIQSDLALVGLMPCRAEVLFPESEDAMA